MSEEQSDDSDDDGRDADEETVGEVDHEHPKTGETFDRTGVHGRGKEHPEESADDDTADETPDSSGEGTAEETNGADGS